ncbi:MAG: T9SS type A sorting domain-containing protein, partial [Gloeomargaritales cyanobacterium]
TARNIGNDQVRPTQIIYEGDNLGEHTKIYMADLFHDGALQTVISYDQKGYIYIYHNDSSITPLTVVQQPITSPDGYSLNEMFPNPSNSLATITYTIPATQTISIGVYNISGQLISTLVNGLVAGGTYAVNYDCSQLPSGMYFVRLTAPNTTLTKQFIHLA